MSDEPTERSPRPTVDQIDFRHLAGLAADPIAVHDGGVLVWGNAAAAALVGAPSPESLVGMSMLGFVAPEFRADVVRRAQRMLGEGSTSPATEEEFIRLDGSRVRVETSGASLGGGLTMVVARDVSRRYEAERAQRAAESRLRAFYEVATDGIGIARASDQTHLMVNAAHARMFGFERPEEEVGTPLAALIAPDAAARTAELARPLLAGEARSVEVVTRGLRRDGTEFDLQVNVTRFSDGEEELLAATLRDVTERRRAEEERDALERRLRQSEKLEAIGRLAGGIAHDFNNILSGILGFAELTLLETPAGTDAHDHQERIKEAALRARALVRQILAFSRLDRAAHQVVDVPAVVSEALALLRAGVPATVTLETHLDPSAGTTLADPTQIHQIVLNLCANARDAVGAYGRIEVEVARADGGAGPGGLPPGRWIRLRVRDDGLGIDDATRARLFEPYMTTKGPFGGHGLGLAVVHGIVTAAGGSIRVETAPGRGSTFDVHLPRREEAPPQRDDAPPALPSGRGERILLVDDEPMVRDSHRRVLESLGYAVEAASDGEEGLARLREHPQRYDLVLTDQTMPRRSGSDLAAAVAGLDASLPVILCTGYSDRVATGELPPGVSEVHEKPLDRATLALVVRRVLDGGEA